MILCYRSGELRSGHHLRTSRQIYLLVEAKYFFCLFLCNRDISWYRDINVSSLHSSALIVIDGVIRFVTFWLEFS